MLEETGRPAVRRRQPRTASQHRAGSGSARSQSQVRAALPRDREGARLRRPVAGRNRSAVGSRRSRLRPTRAPETAPNCRGDSRTDSWISSSSTCWSSTSPRACSQAIRLALARPAARISMTCSSAAAAARPSARCSCVEPLAGQRRDRQRRPRAAPLRRAAASRSLVGEQVDLVPRLEPRRRALLPQPERRQHVVDVVALRLVVGMRHVADVDQQVGRRAPPPASPGTPRPARSAGRRRNRPCRTGSPCRSRAGGFRAWSGRGSRTADSPRTQLRRSSD